ncbi:MAG TPA: hypothetical protein DEP84_04985 [Chloroflexi bacterium]|nr:hypothetical protein [Chloroflexota bacterium]
MGFGQKRQEEQGFRALRRTVLFRPIEALWSAVFAVVGSAAHPARRVGRWSPARGRVLVVAPHPDDETLGCGGTIALHGRAGDEVVVLIVTDGGASRAATHSQRAAESAGAAVTIGGTWHRLALPEGAWRFPEGREQIRRVLAKYRPDLLYAPSGIDYHPEHVRVARALAAALGEAGLEPRVRVYEVGVPLTPLLANHLVELGAAADLKARALAAYASQQGAIRPIRRLHRYNRRLYGAGGEVEIFWEMPAPSYARLLAAGEQRVGRFPFRGIRERPFGDLLPFLVGLNERSRLRAACAPLDDTAT